jgi:invasion protein IalB
MPVTKTALLLATTFCLVLGTSVSAQDTTAPAADGTATTTDGAAPDGLSMGREADTGAAPDGIGTTYVAETFGDWEQRCVRTEDGADPCQLYQLLRDSEANPVAEISVFGLPAGQQAAAGATIIVPLETLLTEELTMIVDSSKPRRYPFSWCSTIGCFARVGFTADEVAAFKKGNKAELSIVPVVAPDQQVKVQVSLTGFTAGYDAVNKANGN